MYLSFYGLKLKPFRDSTNPSFFWLGEMHKEVLTIFRYGILKMPGFLVLTGDIGTGKTALAYLRRAPWRPNSDIAWSW